MAEDNFPKSKFEIKSPKIDVGTLMVSFLNSKNKKKNTNGGELLWTANYGDIYLHGLTLVKINNRRITVFIRNRNKTLFCDVIKRELLYLWRHSDHNSPKTLTLHSP